LVFYSGAFRFPDGDAAARREFWVSARRCVMVALKLGLPVANRPAAPKIGFRRFTDPTVSQVVSGGNRPER
jgi:hypothetical protein